MKKTYPLTHPKLNLARLIEAAKHDAKKYMKREQRKELPADADFWGFDCKYGIDEESAKVIHVAEINKHMDEAESEKLESFYLEIVAKPVVRTKKPIVEENEESDDDDDLSPETGE